MKKHKKSNCLLKSGAIVGMLLMGGVAQAQFLRTSYFMDGTHYRMQLNPALTPQKGFVSIPVIGTMNASLGSTSLGYQDIIDIIDDGDNFYNNPKFMNRLDNKNTMNLNFNTDILSAGWYAGKNFWSVNVGLRADLGANVTKSMFKFLNEMSEIKDNWRQSAYDIGKQRVDVNSYAEVGVGFARPINERLSVGGRAKVLMGLANMNVKMNRVDMYANLPSDERINQLSNLTTSDVNTPEKVNAIINEINNYQAHLNVDATLDGSFKGLELQKNEQGYIDKVKFESSKIGIAGFGLGIDLGASYKVMDNLSVSASILDLGFISWSKSSNQQASAHSNFEMKGSDYTQNIDISSPEAASASINANIQKLQNDANTYMNRVNGGSVLDYDLIQLETNEQKQSRSTSLASTFVVGAEYGFLNNKLSVGLLSTTRLMESKTLTELTLSGNYRPKSWLNASLSYSVIQSLGKTFGLGLKLGPLFVGTDYMFLGKNTNTVNAFLGISVPLGGSKKDSSI